MQKKYGDKRRTVIASDTGEPEYTADDFIVEEDNVVIVSRDGWVKRQKEVKDLVDDAAARRATRCWRRSPAARARRACSSATSASAYTCRIIDVPASTGYGEPIQRLFKLKDGEKVVAALSLDPRVDRRHQAATKRGSDDVDPAPVHAVAVTSDGYALRFGLEPFVEPSTRAGRRFARPADGAEVVGVARITGDEILIAATAEARGLLCRADEVNYLSGPARASSSSSCRPTTTACSASSPRPATATC